MTLKTTKILRGAALSLALMLASCQSQRMVPHTQRVPMIPKPGNKNGVYRDLSRVDQQTAKVKPPLPVIIDKRDSARDTGSLMDLRSDRNIVYPDIKPVAVGDTITLAVTSPRTKKPADGAPAAPTGDLDLPDLGPVDAEAKPIENLVMKVRQRLPNGNFIVQYQSESISTRDDTYTYVTAILDGEKRFNRKALSTDDLSEINFRQKAGPKEDYELSSTGWLDEYTLRLSGFNQAKSRQALELEEKRKRLAKIRNNLRNRIQSFKKEREKVILSREKFRQKLTEQKQQSQAQQTKLTESQSRIDALNTEIADLKKKLADAEGKK